MKKADGTRRLDASLLQRAGLTPEFALKLLEDIESDSDEQASRAIAQCNSFFSKFCPELLRLPSDRFKFEAVMYSGAPGWERVLHGLAPRYIPDHQAMLKAVHRLMVQ
ncbi:hypothetical protein [Rhodobacter capsulatus]